MRSLITLPGGVGRPSSSFGGKGFFIEEPKDLKGALQEAMDFSSLPGA